jgi:acetyl-CoA carboxylase biotin carboxyl carrier protein
MAVPSNPESGIDRQLIREVAELLAETGLTEIEIEQHGVRIRVARGGVPVGVALAAAPNPPAAPAAAAAAALTDPAAHPGVIKSPMVGTVFRAAAPGAPPFVDQGTEVKLGQTLLIIEAMKTMNQIPAPRAGRVTQILVEDGQPVEYGEPLLIIE